MIKRSKIRDIKRKARGVFLNFDLWFRVVDKSSLNPRIMKRCKSLRFTGKKLYSYGSRDVFYCNIDKHHMLGIDVERDIPH